MTAPAPTTWAEVVAAFQAMNDIDQFLYPEDFHRAYIEYMAVKADYEKGQGK